MQNRLKEIRKELGFTQQQLADLVGTSNQQIQRLEAGERRMSDHWMERIAEVLRIEPWALMVSPKSIPSQKDLEMISRVNSLPQESQDRVWAFIAHEEFVLNHEAQPQTGHVLHDKTGEGYAHQEGGKK